MSLHGTQLRFPFAINKKSQNELFFEASLAVNFAEIVNRIDDDEKFTKFTIIMWPFILIQSEPNFHVMIDDTSISKFQEDLTNPPRTAQIGHVLRDPLLDNLKKLELAKKIIAFQHRIQLDEEEASSAHDEEFLHKSIEGLVEPGVLEGIKKIIRRITPFQMQDFTSLESLYTFDDALNFAQEYINTIEFARGTDFRWKSIRTIVNEPVEKWRVNLSVDIKDAEERFKSSLMKAQQIDEKIIETKLDSARDNVDQWVLMENKNIISKIGGMFMSLDLILEDLRKKNRFFLNTDTLRTYKIEDVVPKAYKHIAHIRSSLEQSEEALQEISSKMNAIRQEVENTSLSAEDRIRNLNGELMNKKNEQEEKIKSISETREKEINEIQTHLETINKIVDEIEQKIEEKLNNTLLDEKNLRKWQIDDEISKITTPTVRYFLPIGIGIIEDEDEDERIEIVLPSYIEPDLKRTYLSEDFGKFEKKVTKMLDKNMKIRSNFEFALEKKNTKKNPEMIIAIKKGFDFLEKDNLIEPEKKEYYLSILNKM